MSEQFDPYYRWLGIRPEEQPADHYRLLALARFEDEPEVIRDAAEQRMRHVRAYQLGEHRKVAQKILNELATAKGCLLNEAKKAKYDEGLRNAADAHTNPPTTQTAAIERPLVVLENARKSQEVVINVPPSTSRPIRSSYRTSVQRLGPMSWWRSTPTIIVAGACGMLLIVGLIWMALPSASDSDQSKLTGQGKRLPFRSQSVPDEPALALAPFDSAKARQYQKDWADHLGLDVEITNSVGMRLALIPPGEFIMGSPKSEKDRRDEEQQQHRVRITEPFYLAATEVTQGQWEAVMGTQPWNGQSSVKEGSDYAASYVNWEAAQSFCERLSHKDGTAYRLPSEAEWEFACRAGTTTAYHFGDDASRLGEYAWLIDNAHDADEKYAHQVGQKKPNPFGLFDMSGNVWEWCEIGLDSNMRLPSGELGDPEAGSLRVYRGGGWSSRQRNLRSACRMRRPASYQYGGLGFRIARSQTGK